MKRKAIQLFTLSIIIAILLSSACFAEVGLSPDIMKLSDFIEYNGVEIKENSVIKVNSINKMGVNSQYIEVINYYPNDIIEKTIIKPYAVISKRGVDLINTSEEYISPKSTGYVDVYFSNISITVTTQAYYSGGRFFGFVPYGVTAKWTRATGTTNVVSKMTVNFFIRGALIELESGDTILDNYLYSCKLEQDNPYQHLYYSKYRELPISDTGICIGDCPEYGAGVIVTVIVNGVSYEDEFGI